MGELKTLVSLIFVSPFFLKSCLSLAIFICHLLSFPSFNHYVTFTFPSLFSSFSSCLLSSWSWLLLNPLFASYHFLSFPFLSSCFLSSLIAFTRCCQEPLCGSTCRWPPSGMRTIRWSCSSALLRISLSSSSPLKMRPPEVRTLNLILIVEFCRFFLL